MVYHSDMPTAQDLPYTPGPPQTGDAGTERMEGSYFPPQSIGPAYQPITPADHPFPYPSANDFTGQKEVEWGDTSEPVREMETQQATQDWGRLWRRLRNIEQNQEQFERRLRRLEQRVRVIERRLGIPAPPPGFPRFL
ncbi:hypothetical protein EWH99_11645 [Sporolactobacillus sp. THM7-7]|nr:hypothetical protein EWH99_11645 [Sporolactobacillus sp. THM7-7]